MLAIDIVKPAPKTNLEEHERWKNNLTSNLIAGSIFSKKVIIEHCTGSRLTGCTCPNHADETHDFRMEMADEGRDG